MKSICVVIYFVSLFHWYRRSPYVGQRELFSTVYVDSLTMDDAV